MVIILYNKQLVCYLWKYLCPRNRRSGGIFFFFSRLSFCPPLWNFNPAFEQWVLELWFFTWIFRDNTFPLVSLFFTLYLDLGVWPIFETLNLHHNFCTVKSFEKLVLVCQNGKVFDDVILMRTFLNQLLVANYKLKVL